MAHGECVLIYSSTLILLARWLGLYEYALWYGVCMDILFFAHLRDYNHHGINNRDSSVLVCQGITIGINGRRYKGLLC